MIGIVAGWGLALLPLGLGAPLVWSLMAFAVGGVIYAPYGSLAMAVFQDSVPASKLTSVLAIRAALMIVATPLGTALGGPLVDALGARGTLFASALATIALAVLATVAITARRPLMTALRAGARRA
jgi:predicted MFS family arabinose efflux permease